MLRLFAAVFAFCVLAAVSSFAQSLPASSPSIQQSPPLRGFVPPYEIVRRVRAAGFDPLAPPLREGTTYVVRAIDFRGVAMRVVVDARSGAIRDANRIVSGLYGPYAPGPYPPPQYGRIAAPYPPPDDLEAGYGHPVGMAVIPLPRPRPAGLAATGGSDRKPVARPDIATSAPARSDPPDKPSKDSAFPAIND